jgi:hypothetical protein
MAVFSPIHCEERYRRRLALEDLEIYRHQNLDCCIVLNKTINEQGLIPVFFRLKSSSIHVTRVKPMSSINLKSSKEEETSPPSAITKETGPRTTGSPEPLPSEEVEQKKELGSY